MTLLRQSTFSLGWPAGAGVLVAANACKRLLFKAQVRPFLVSSLTWIIRFLDYRDFCFSGPSFS